jgi:hypothetical protein
MIISDVTGIAMYVEELLCVERVFWWRQLRVFKNKNSGGSGALKS